MKKKLFVLWLGGVSVVALMSVCMVLLFAEPAECENWQQFMLTFAAMKVAAIVCGIVAIWLAGELSDATNGTEKE